MTRKKQKETDRSDLNLQHFMQDMDMIGSQVKNPKLKKTDFNYGDLGVSNYLLWLILAELMMLNDNMRKE